MTKGKEVIVIGGGAAGFFSAINLAMRSQEWKVTILEKTTKLLSKVKVSGGGRCNVTHHCLDNTELIRNYPRGSRELRQVFSRFSVSGTIAWFHSQGVWLKTEADGRMFPQSNESQEIIDCFLRLARDLGIKIITGCEVHAVKKSAGFTVRTSTGEYQCDYVIVASGGHPKSGAYDYIKNLGHTIDEPIPSLFTFNMPDESIRRELQGIAVEMAEVRTDVDKLSYAGPVLITHWGLSGPAVLKLSAFAAEAFHRSGYTGRVSINWAYPRTDAGTLAEIKSMQQQKPKAFPTSNPMFGLPRRLWEFLCQAAEIEPQRPWAETRKSSMERLSQVLTRSAYRMQGKTTFKEEFVTCGGVNLKEIDFRTMESKKQKVCIFAEK